MPGTQHGGMTIRRGLARGRSRPCCGVDRRDTWSSRQQYSARASFGEEPDPTTISAIVIVGWSGKMLTKIAFPCWACHLGWASLTLAGSWLARGTPLTMGPVLRPSPSSMGAAANISGAERCSCRSLASRWRSSAFCRRVGFRMTGPSPAQGRAYETLATRAARRHRLGIFQPRSGAVNDGVV